MHGLRESSGILPFMRGDGSVDDTVDIELLSCSGLQIDKRDAVMVAVRNQPVVMSLPAPACRFLTS